MLILLFHYELAAYALYCQTFHAHDQWRSKALRVPGSTVTWGPPFPSPPVPPPSFPSSSPAQPLPLLRSAPPQIQLGGVGSAVSSPSGVWVGAPAEIEFGTFFSLKIRHLVATILMIFLRVLTA